MTEDVAVQGHYPLVGAGHGHAALLALPSGKSSRYSSRPVSASIRERIACTQLGMSEAPLGDSYAQGVDVHAVDAPIIVVGARTILVLALLHAVHPPTILARNQEDIRSELEDLVAVLLEEPKTSEGPGAQLRGGVVREMR